MRGLFLLLEQKFIKLIKARFTYEKNRIHIHRIQHVLQWSSVIWSTVTGLLALFSFIFEILNYNRYLPTRTMKIRVRHSLHGNWRNMLKRKFVPAYTYGYCKTIFWNTRSLVQSAMYKIHIHQFFASTNGI